MSLRDALRKAAGLIVELPPVEPSAPSAGGSTDLDRIFDQFNQSQSAREGSVKTVEQIVQETDGPNLNDIQLTDANAASAVDAGGQVDFQALYAQSGLPTVPFSAEQMRDMLASLPAELPIETKRQTVKVTLDTMGKTMGMSPETVISDASRKLSALNAFMENLSRQTQEFVSTSESEIAALQSQIEEKKSAIQSARMKLNRASQRCDEESERLDEVLEFFSLDVPPSKHAQ